MGNANSNVGVVDWTGVDDSYLPQPLSDLIDEHGTQGYSVLRLRGMRDEDLAKVFLDVLNKQQPDKIANDYIYEDLRAFAMDMENLDYVVKYIREAQRGKEYTEEEANVPYVLSKDYRNLEQERHRKEIKNSTLYNANYTWWPRDSPINGMWYTDQDWKIFEDKIFRITDNEYTTIVEAEREVERVFDDAVDIAATAAEASSKVAHGILDASPAEMGGVVIGIILFYAATQFIISKAQTTYSQNTIVRRRK